MNYFYPIVNILYLNNINKEIIIFFFMTKKFMNINNKNK